MRSNLRAKIYDYRVIFFSIVASSLVLPIIVNSIFLGLYFFYWLIIIPNKEKLNGLKVNRNYLLLYILFFILNGLSLFYSDNLSHAFRDIEGKLSLLILPLILFGQNSFSKKQMKQSGLIFSYTIAASSILAVLLSLIKFKSILVNQEFAGLVGMHASYFGLYVAFSFFFFLNSYLKEKNKLNLIPIIILFISLVLLSPRIIILGFILVNIIWFVGIGLNLKKILFGLLGLVLIGAISWSIQPLQKRIIEAVNFKDKVELDTDPDLHLTIRPYGGRAIRVAIWTCSLDVLNDYWLTGVGIGDVHTHLQESYKNHAFEFAWKYNNYNAHNLFIETTIAFGVVGVLILLTLFYFLFSSVIKNKSLLGFAFVLLFLSLSLMESTFNVQRGVVFFSLFSPFFLAHKVNSLPVK